jgi:hypothetical protein
LGGGSLTGPVGQGKRWEDEAHFERRDLVADGGGSRNVHDKNPGFAVTRKFLSVLSVEAGRPGRCEKCLQMEESKRVIFLGSFVTGTWQTFGLPQEGMKIASRPPRGGGSPHWFLGKLCGGQLIDFKLEIGGPFPRTDDFGDLRPSPRRGVRIMFRGGTSRSRAWGLFAFVSSAIGSCKLGAEFLATSKSL